MSHIHTIIDYDAATSKDNIGKISEKTRKRYVETIIFIFQKLQKSSTSVAHERESITEKLQLHSKTYFILIGCLDFTGTRLDPKRVVHNTMKDLTVYRLYGSEKATSPISDEVK